MDFKNPERIKILTKLDKKLESLHISGLLCSFLWASDLDVLKRWLEKTPAEIFMVDKGLSVCKHIHQWKQRMGRDSNPYAPDRTEQRKVDAERCYQRDYSCVFTGMKIAIDAVHIYPHSMEYKAFSKDDLLGFWILLKLFWPQEKVLAWEKAVEEAEEDFLINLITMSPNMHAFWGLCLFALKPISATPTHLPTELTMEFNWLHAKGQSARSKGQSARSGINPQDPPTLQPGGTREHNIIGLECSLRSGDIITMRTTDPENLPLPSIEILSMLWALQQVVALQGGCRT